MFPGRFEGKALVVTGAAQGLGEAVATRAAREGAAVALIDRSEIVYEVAEKLVSEGAQAVAFIADLERYLGCSTAMAAARSRLGGRIDVLINNVGGTIWRKPYVHYQESEIEAEIRRSLFPTLWCCRAVLPAMIEQSRGTIVNVSSVATRGLNRVPYAAAKGGVNAVTASLAWEVAEHGIRVVAAAPGGIEAPERRIARGPTGESEQELGWHQTTVDQTIASSVLHRYGTLDEQVAPILFLASDEASYITGTRLPVAGGDLG
jgi:dihydroxycyclohexadiene carboxylate dehydrogenase